MYKELFQKAERINAQIQQSITAENAEKFVENYPAKSFITYKEAMVKYHFDLYQYAEDLLLVYHGDVSVDGNIDSEWMELQLYGMDPEGEVMGMLVEGNLRVNGDILDEELFEIFVTENLYCHFMYSYMGWIEVNGDAHFRYGIYGEDNDGAFHLEGKAFAPYLVDADHHMPTESEDEFVYIDVYDCDLPKNLFAFKPWEDNGYFNGKQFFDLVRKGENPFLDINS